MGNIKYLIVGLIFGVLFVKSEIISWFRIQEMFHFHAFHMYGVLGTAVTVGVISVFILKKLKLTSLEGQPIDYEPKVFNKGQVIGGLIFGVGWAITGACPGPIYAVFGSRFTVFIIVLLSALAGTWVYGFFRDKLPH